MEEVGMGADPLETMVTNVANKVLDGIMPKVKGIVEEASAAAQPTISRVVREDVMPWVVVGLLGVGVAAAVIGSAMCRRR